jgi:hypothetical protein
MWTVQELKDQVLDEVKGTTDWPLLLDLYYAILKSRGQSYVRIRAARIRLDMAQIKLWQNCRN